MQSFNQHIWSKVQIEIEREREDRERERRQRERESSIVVQSKNTSNTMYVRCVQISLGSAAGGGISSVNPYNTRHVNNTKLQLVINNTPYLGVAPAGGGMWLLLVLLLEGLLYACMHALYCFISCAMCLLVVL